MNGANSTGAAAEAERSAGQVRRHRQALAVIGELVDERRRRRMKRRAAQAAQHEDDAERQRRGGQADRSSAR